MFFVAGWFGAMIPEKSDYYSLYQLIAGLGGTAFIVRWAMLDALERRFQLTPLWIIFFILISLLAVPFYLFKTRGKNSLRLVLVASALLISYSISAGVGATVATVLGLATPEYKAMLMSPSDSK